MSTVTDYLFIIRLRRKNKTAHIFTVKTVKSEEEKKNNKLKTDPNYNPPDKDIFINNIEVWRIQCYNILSIY